MGRGRVGVEKRLAGRFPVHAQAVDMQDGPSPLLPHAGPIGTALRHTWRAGGAYEIGLCRAPRPGSWMVGAQTGAKSARGGTGAERVSRPRVYARFSRGGVLYP